MADLTELEWWKAREIPFIEWNWASIRRYLPEDEGDVLSEKRCTYVVRMSPPYLISYNRGESPVVYVGSGNINQRWSNHRDWLHEIGLSLPGSRYEVGFACRVYEITQR